MLGSVWLLVCFVVALKLCFWVCMRAHASIMCIHTSCMCTHAHAQKPKFRVLTILFVLLSFNHMFRSCWV